MDRLVFVLAFGIPLSVPLPSSLGYLASYITLLSYSISPPSMEFERGQRVEILSQEEGFEGSYFPAVVISQVSTDTYILQYSTLHEAKHEGYNEFQPLREFCKTREIRPTPPEISLSKFCVKDKVDAYYNDGWWLGEIVKCISTSLGKKYYLVYFKKFAEKIRFEFHDLRLHQDWSKGQWSIPRKVGRPVGSKGNANNQSSKTDITRLVNKDSQTS